MPIPFWRSAHANLESYDIFPVFPLVNLIYRDNEKKNVNILKDSSKSVIFILRSSKNAAKLCRVMVLMASPVKERLTERLIIESALQNNDDNL